MKKRNAGYIEIDKETLYDLYVNKGKTLSYIAKFVMYCSHPTVINRMKEYNIPRREAKTGRRPKYRSAYYNSEGELLCPTCDHQLYAAFQYQCKVCGQHIK